MAQALLVNIDIDLGRRIVQALEEKGRIKLSVAMWAFLSEYYGDWRIILASRELDDLGIRDASGTVGQVLRNAGIAVYNEPTITVFKTTAPLIKGLRRTYAKSPAGEGLRITGSFGDIWVEDSYVYRIA